MTREQADELQRSEWRMIFEFNEIEQAEAFAVEVKKSFGLDGRVFDDAEVAANSHAFPWEQRAPVVHIDRPRWKLEWSAAFAVERRIEKMATEFGANFGRKP
jgi:hypothetical protein